MIFRQMKLLKLKRQYRKKNAHNFTMIGCICNINKIEVGKATYGNLKVFDWSDSNAKLKIGSYCSVGPDVLFLLAGEHNTSTITTYPIKYRILNRGYEALTKGDIVLKDDVWIGANVVICSGVTINQGAVVAAGSIVTKDVPPYAIVGGNPARVIRYRFDDSIIKRLLSLDICSLIDSVNNNNVEAFYWNIESIGDCNTVLKKIGNNVLQVRD